MTISKSQNINETRADWAQDAVEAYAVEHRNDTREEALRDLMCNLLHLAERFGFDVNELQAASLGAYSDERVIDGFPVERDVESGRAMLRCPSCDEPFTETGPASPSLADSEARCVDCFTEDL